MSGSAIEKILKRLSEYPGLQFGKAGPRLEIAKPNPGGFPMSFVEEAQGFSVYFGPLRCRFESEDEALDHLAFGLSKKCRLREMARGKPYKWILEQETAEGWRAMREAGFLFFRFWRGRTEVVYQNALLSE